MAGAARLTTPSTPPAISFASGWRRLPKLDRAGDKCADQSKFSSRSWPSFRLRPWLTNGIPGRRTPSQASTAAQGQSAQRSRTLKSEKCRAAISIFPLASSSRFVACNIAMIGSTTAASITRNFSTWIREVSGRATHAVSLRRIPRSALRNKDHGRGDIRG